VGLRASFATTSAVVASADPSNLVAPLTDAAAEEARHVTPGWMPRS
jgi:hypothetical protein